MKPALSWGDLLLLPLIVMAFMLFAAISYFFGMPDLDSEDEG
jgi:hypothetical protein